MPSSIFIEELEEQGLGRRADLHFNSWAGSAPKRLEVAFEQIILTLADKIFPSYLCLAWKPLVSNDLIDEMGDTKGAKPDLVLIHKTFSKWWVVEVEKQEHSFDRHIKPQLERLNPVNGANYNILMQNDRTFMQRFEDKAGEQYERFEAMSRLIDPGLLCIIDDEDIKVREYCKNNLVQYLTCKPFGNKDGVRALLVGEIPSSITSEPDMSRFYLKWIGDQGDSNYLMQLEPHFPNEPSVKLSLGTRIVNVIITHSNNRHRLISLNKAYVDTSKGSMLRLLDQGVYKIENA